MVNFDLQVNCQFVNLRDDNNLIYNNLIAF